MKNLLYHKNKDKGKVYPSPSPSSSRNNNNKDDVLNQLLPAAILVHLVSVLSLEDREVLSYLLTMSLKSTTSDHRHKPPCFDCGCFGCYTSFWSRWDSSPNRKLIHTVIEAFEQDSSKRDDELLCYSSSSKHRAGKKKRKDKMKKRVGKEGEMILPESEPEMKRLVTVAEEDVAVLSECVNERKGNEEVKEEEGETVAAAAEETGKQVAVVTNGGHKGLPRMVLPDLFGILSCRLWSLWSPNV